MKMDSEEFFTFQQELFEKAEAKKDERQEKQQLFQRELFTGLFKMLSGPGNQPIRNSQETDEEFIPSQRIEVQTIDEGQETLISDYVPTRKAAAKGKEKATRGRGRGRGRGKK